jgi:hypothetical protein
VLPYFSNCTVRAIREIQSHSETTGYGTFDFVDRLQSSWT